MMVSARVCTKIPVGRTGNLDVLLCALSLSLSVYCTNTVFTAYIVYVDNYMTVTWAYHILYSKLTEGRTCMMAILRYFSALNHGWNWNGCLIKSTGCLQTWVFRFAYAYAKRGQVLLCEEWAKSYPKAKS